MPAPPERRRDHLLALFIGLIVAALMCVTASQLSSGELVGNVWRFSAAGRVEFTLYNSILLAITLVALVLAQRFFARRSSLGNLVIGLTLLAVEFYLLHFLSQAYHELLSKYYDFPRIVVYMGISGPGILLLLAALFLGSAWGMRRARRAGRAEEELLLQIAATDQKPGQKPIAPPSRRPQRILSLLLYPLGFAACTTILFSAHSGLNDRVAGLQLETESLAVAFLAAIGIVALTATSGESTLGLRVAGIITVLLGLFSSLTHSLNFTFSDYFNSEFLLYFSSIHFILLGLLLLLLARGISHARQAGQAQEHELHALG